MTSTGITEIFIKVFDRKYFVKFAAAGFIFSYNYDVTSLKHDRRCLGCFKPLLSEMLKFNSNGLWLPNMLQDAISKLEETSALNFHNTESVRTQAAHLCKYYRDVKQIRSALFIVCIPLLTLSLRRRGRGLPIRCEICLT